MIQHPWWLGPVMMVVGFGGAALSRRRRRLRRERADVATPMCGVENCCAASYPHTHAPGTGWIQPDSWDYENNCPSLLTPCETCGKPPISSVEDEACQCCHGCNRLQGEINALRARLASAERVVEAARDLCLHATMGGARFDRVLHELSLYDAVEVPP